MTGQTTAQQPQPGTTRGPGYKLLLDVPSAKPALGFDRRATALAEIVAGSDPRFAVAIFGGWGSGKTTLMEAIARKLDASVTVCVTFSAWRYEREEHLIVPLLDTVREALVDWSRVNEPRPGPAARAASLVGKVTTSLLAGVSLKVGLPSAVELSFEANKALEAAREAPSAENDSGVPRSVYHACFRGLETAFRDFVGSQTGRRIVIFVDDLDRCLPEKAVQVLESMKLFFDLTGFVFVVGLDREIVQRVIDAKYSQRDLQADGTTSLVSGAEYVKKIFQLPYLLTPVSVDQIHGFLEAAYDEARLPQEQREELRAFVEPHLRFVAEGRAVNPREVKRYINTYILLTKVEAGLEKQAVLALQTIDFRDDWRHEATGALFAYGDLFIDALRRRVRQGEATALEDLDPALTSIPDDFLQYLAPGAPGAPLLDVPDVDRYLRSGESVRSTPDTGTGGQLIDAIRYVGEIRRWLREAQRTRTLTVDRAKEIHQRMSGAQSLVLSFTPTQTLLGSLLEQDAQTFMNLVSALVQRPPDAGADWEAEAAPTVAELNAIADRVSERLLRLYRFDEAPPPVSPPP